MANKFQNPWDVGGEYYNQNALNTQFLPEGFLETKQSYQEWKAEREQEKKGETYNHSVNGSIYSKWNYDLIKKHFISGRQILEKEYQAGKSGSKEKQRWKDLIDNKANTCAIRLSYALNNAGYIIKEHKTNSGTTTWTSNLNSKHEYILSADDMGYYLKNQLGIATIKSGGIIKSDAQLEAFIDDIADNWKNYKGLLYLDSKNWKDYQASGHVDLIYEDWGNDPYILGTGEELDDYIDWRNNDGGFNKDAQLDVFIWLLKGEKK